MILKGKTNEKKLTTTATTIIIKIATKMVMHDCVIHSSASNFHHPNETNREKEDLLLQMLPKRHPKGSYNGCVHFKDLFLDWLPEGFVISF